jgi:phosphatidate cytidylyltransferase
LGVDLEILWKRIITSVILIPAVLLAVIYLPYIYWEFLTAILLSLAAFEWLKLIGIVKWQHRSVYFAILWLLFIGASLISPVWYLPTLSISFFVWLSALGLVLCYSKINQKILKKILLGWSGSIISLLILVFCWVGCNVLHAHGIRYIFAVLFTVWAADTGAYFVGRFFGKHKLMPKVSPKKTIEGLIGGILLAFLVYNLYLSGFSYGWTLIILAIAIFMGMGCFLKLLFWELVFVIIIAIIYCLVYKAYETSGSVLTVVAIVLFAALGDLFESMLKRIAEVKDSGNLLPGHGGVLDRIDSLLSAVPVFAFMVLFNINI